MYSQLAQSVMALLTTVLLMWTVSSFFCVSAVTGGHPHGQGIFIGHEHPSSLDDNVSKLLNSEGNSHLGRLVRSVMERKPYHSHHDEPTTAAPIIHGSRRERSIQDYDEGTTTSPFMTEIKMKMTDELVEVATMILPLFDYYLPEHIYSLPPTKDDLMLLKEAVWKMEQQEGHQQKDTVISLLNSS